MKLEEVQTILDAEPAWQTDCGETEVTTCHASDLISDILAFRGASSLLQTGITNAQVIRTAEIMDFDAVVFVRGKEPQPQTIELAKQQKIPLFVTPLSMYESCGRLYANGLPAGAIKEAVVDCRSQK